MTYTSYIRQKGQGNYNNPAVADVYHFVTCIKIQLVWIILPGSLTLGTVSLLIFSICISRRRRETLWESSPLAFIFNGPCSSHGQRQATTGAASPAGSSGGSLPRNTLHTISDMEDAAGRIRVKLDDSEGTPSLRIFEQPLLEQPSTDGQLPAPCTKKNGLT